MSKAAYENYFRQPAPEGALFGADVSWFQATANGLTPDYATAKGYWQDLVTWANFVCIRVSYGANGDDGAQALHFQLAQELGYQGKLGVYHFQHAEAGWQANFNNFMAKSAPFVNLIDFYMHDYEASPNAGASYIKTTCTATEDARLKPVSNYGGKGYMDAAGVVACPSAQLWVAHYPARSANAWSPTTDWNSNGAPLMPNQYPNEFPGVWQWQSVTPEHGHLDLNISTTPEQFGIGETEVPTQAEWDSMIATLNDVANRTEADHPVVEALGSLVLPGMKYDLRDTSNNAAANHEMLKALTPEAIAKAVVAALPPSTGSAPVDYDKIAKIVSDALAKLVLKSS